MCFRVEDEDVLMIKFEIDDPSEDDQLVFVQGLEGSVEAWGENILIKFDY